MDDIYQIADLLKNYQASVSISGALATLGGVDTSDPTFAPNVETISLPGKKNEEIVGDFRLGKRNFIGRTFLSDYNFSIRLKVDGEMQLYQKLERFLELNTQNGGNLKGKNTSDLHSNLVINFLGMNNEVFKSINIVNFLLKGLSNMEFNVTSSGSIQTFEMQGTIDWWEWLS